MLLGLCVFLTYWYIKGNVDVWSIGPYTASERRVIDAGASADTFDGCDAGLWHAAYGKSSPTHSMPPIPPPRR